MPASDLFLSHSSGDGEAARVLRGILEAAGFTCWMAPDDIVGTETWTEQILDAIAGTGDDRPGFDGSAQVGARVARGGSRPGQGPTGPAHPDLEIRGRLER